MPYRVRQLGAGLAVFCIGVSVVVSGFLYDLLFAGIPYQDPPPEIQQRYLMHAAIAGRLYSIGGAILLAGCLLLVVQYGLHIWRQRQARIIDGR